MINQRDITYLFFSPRGVAYPVNQVLITSVNIVVNATGKLINILYSSGMTVTTKRRANAQTVHVPILIRLLCCLLLIIINQSQKFGEIMLLWSSLKLDVNKKFQNASQYFFFSKSAKYESHLNTNWAQWNWHELFNTPTCPKSILNVIQTDVNLEQKWQKHCVFFNNCNPKWSSMSLELASHHRVSQSLRSSLSVRKWFINVEPLQQALIANQFTSKWTENVARQLIQNMLLSCSPVTLTVLLSCTPVTLTEDQGHSHWY